MFILFFVLVFTLISTICVDCNQLNFVKSSDSFVKINGGFMYKNGPGNANSTLVKVNSFYVKDRKVTNRDYRDIMLFARDRGLNRSVDILVPDYTLSIETLNMYGIGCDRLTSYFLDPKYDDYPVVGLTYEQILEYIRLKSEKDGVRYRLLTDDEYDFLIYEVSNVYSGGDVKIIQNECFDDTFKNLVELKNDAIRLENLKIREENIKNKHKLCGKKKNPGIEKNLLKYDFMSYYNLRPKGLALGYSRPFYTSVYKYSPNGFLIYDLIGNLYEVTCRESDLSEYSDVENYSFILCGGSCFDFYDDIINDVPKFYDYYDTIRYDRGFRLVKDV